MPNKKIAIIYNPNAGHGRAGKKLEQVKLEFLKKGLDFDLFLGEYPGHGQKIVSELNFEKYDGLISAGGDGSLFEVINGYYANKRKVEIPIGVLPVGTGNAFAHDMDLDSSKWKDAIDIIAQANTKKIDVGYFRTQGKDYYFLNILGLGFVADVSETAGKLKLLGNISYTLGVIYRTIKLDSDLLTMEIDGKTIQHQSLFVEVSNTRYTGSDFLMAPNAKVDDGLLDITVAKLMTRRKLLKSLTKIFTGEHIHIEEIETYKAKKIRIESGSPKILTPDGELMGSTPVAIECLPQAIKVFWR